MVFLRGVSVAGMGGRGQCGLRLRVLLWGVEMLDHVYGYKASQEIEGLSIYSILEFWVSTSYERGKNLMIEMDGEDRGRFGAWSCHFWLSVI